MAECTPDAITPRVPCNACPTSEVVDMPKGAVTANFTNAVDDNFAIVQCLVDLCLANKASEELTAVAPAASLLVGNSNIDSTANAVDATLADGTYVGQEKYFIMTEASNSSTVTVANHETSAPEVFTFDALDESLMLKWTGAVWSTIGTATATV